jgi:hypothetical protein
VFEGAVQRVAGLEGELGDVVADTGTRAHPAFFRDDDGDRFVDHLLLGHRFLRFLDDGAAHVAEGLGVGFDFADDHALHRRRVLEDVVQRGFFLAQFGQLLLDLDGL